MDRLNAALEGRYRIERELGQGGMATVFLADDIRHDRKVALKVLKPELAAVVGADRFLAEIKTTANLQHPHILPLFDSGEADAFLFYVMPYVEGESLREKLDREKQLSVEDAVDIAEKVAEALQYAHEQGVVHRDVKPANILMSRGEPLVADFGIALALSEAGGGRITETGLSLGTPHYMSPEQASGDQSLDKRSDVYALGCILYEMLTGEPPYGGATAQSVLARILTGDARRITELRHTVPLNVDAAVAKALEKLPADRFASAQDFVRALEDDGFRHVTREPAKTRRRPDSGGGWLAGRGRVIAGIAAALVLGLLAGYLLRPGPPPEPVFMATIQFPEDQQLMDIPFGPAMTVSADGALLVYTGPSSSLGWQLWLRRADALQATPLSNTANAFTPIISPASDAVAFIQGTDLKVVGIGTGTSRTLDDDAGAIADWTDDGWIYYLAANSNRFFRVAASGGEPQLVPGLSPQEGGASSLFTYGDVLPGGETGVWTTVPINGNAAQLSVVFVDLETSQPRELARGSSPRYLKDGHLVWVSPEGVLMAARFDPRAGELKGPPVPVAEGVRTDPNGGFSGGVSETGGLVYQAGTSQGASMHLRWYGRNGDTASVAPDWEIMPTAQGNWSGLDLSPDGSRIVTADGAGGGGQLWVKDLETDAPPNRITFEGSFHVRPRWMPDGRSVTFISNLGGDSLPTQVWTRAADGSGAARALAADDVEIEEALVSPDGQWLVYRRGGTTAGRDIYIKRMGQDSTGRPLIATEADEKSPRLSPDGRWIAYTSNETGQFEVFVRPFPDVSGGRWQISLGGGFGPLWAHSGRELLYYSPQENAITVAHLNLQGATMAVAAREPLFHITDQYVDQNYTPYDISADDQRLLMFTFGAGEAGSVIWVRNWLTGWRKRAGEGM